MIVKRLILCEGLLALFLVSTTFGTSTQINYISTDLGSGRWEYTYDVCNINLSVYDQPRAIDEFTIWFDYGLYDNLTVTTPNPPSGGWDEIVWQPEPVIGDDGGYDALTKNLNIGVGESVYGFAVSFDWLGIDEPGSQYYEIIDPVTFGIGASGYTVPEPTTCLLLLSGAVLLRLRKN